jgi:type 1 fimbria pilin
MLNSSSGRIFFSVLTLLVMTPCSVLAEEIVSYSYLEANIVTTTVNLNDSTDDIEGNGFGFSLSLDIDPNFAFSLSVISTTFKTFQDIEVDSAKRTDLGLIAHTTIAPATDVFAQVALTKAEVTVDDGATSGSDSDYGSMFGVGIRHKGRNGLELELAGSNTEVFDSSTFSYHMSARLYFKKVFSAGFGFISSDDADSYLFNARMDL